MAPADGAPRRGCSSCTRSPIPSISTPTLPRSCRSRRRRLQEAQSIAWFESAGSSGRSAVRFVNTTSQTLPAGTLAFFADGGFAGESALARLKPGERRFIAYGFDLDVELSTASANSHDESKRLLWDKAAERLDEHYLRTSDVTYVVENRSGRARRVILKTDLSANAELKGADSVDFDQDSGHPLAVIDVPAHKKVERPIHSVEGLVRASSLSSLTAAHLTELAASPSLEPADKTIAAEGAARLREAEEDAKSIATTKEDLAQLEKDLERLREEMKAFNGEHSAAGARDNPFAARVLASEDKLGALRKKLESAETDQKGKIATTAATLARLVR